MSGTANCCGIALWLAIAALPVAKPRDPVHERLLPRRGLGGVLNSPKFYVMSPLHWTDLQQMTPSDAGRAVSPLARSGPSGLTVRRYSRCVPHLLGSSPPSTLG